MVVVEMKKEKQVVCLELAKRLEELGIKQESICCWWKSEVDGWRVLYDPTTIYRIEGYNAYTVAELGEILPYYVHSYKEDARSRRWCCNEGDKQCFSNTEANARAKMLIYLVECNKIQRAKT